MKKFLVCLTGLLMCCLCSCRDYENAYESKCERNVVHINTGNMHAYNYDVVEFEYKEHGYIGFGSGHGLGVVHNPDCKKCRKEVVE